MPDTAPVASGTAPVSSASGAPPISSSSSTAPVNSGVSAGSSAPATTPPGVTTEAASKVVNDANGNPVWEETETKTWTENAWKISIEVSRIAPNCFVKVQQQYNAVTRKSSRRCVYAADNTYNAVLWGGISGALFAVGVGLIAVAVVVGTGGAAAPVVGALAAGGGAFLGGGGMAFKEGRQSDKFKRGNLISTTPWSEWIITGVTSIGTANVSTTPIPCDREIEQPTLWVPQHTTYDGIPVSTTAPPPLGFNPGQ